MITVGQVLYENVEVSRGVKEIKERTVTKVGRKYFYVDNGKEGFSLDELLYENENYSQFNRKLYKAKQSIIDKNRHNELSFYIKSKFNYYGTSPFTLDQLERINNIINE